MATQLTAYEECLRNPRARLQVATAKVAIAKTSRNNKKCNTTRPNSGRNDKLHIERNQNKENGAHRLLEKS